MSDMVTIPREVADLALDALRNAKVNAIAHYSGEPYKDDPRWSPWTRFGSRVASRCERAETALRAAVSRMEGPTS